MMLVRKMVKGIGLLALMVVSLFFSGCETLEQKRANASTDGRVASSIDTITSGDKLLIEFNDVNPPLGPINTTVRADGTVTLPYNVIVNANEKTWSQLANEIRDKYVPSIYRRLTVTVRGEDRFYTVLGQVNNPGPKNYFGQITLLRAIAAAGDFTEFAKKTNVRITRSNGQTLKVNAKKAIENPDLDLPIYPGDKVFVDRRFW